MVVVVLVFRVARSAFVAALLPCSGSLQAGAVEAAPGSGLGSGPLEKYNLVSCLGTTDGVHSPAANNHTAKPLQATTS